MMPIQRLQNESEQEHKFRIVTDKVDKVIDIDWLEIMDMFNINCSSDHFRKMGQGMAEVYKYYQENKQYDVVEDKTDEELYKDTIKFRDQKREYYNLLKNQSRFEHLQTEIKEAIKELEYKKPLTFKQANIKNPSKNVGVTIWSDWHYGMVVENMFNTFNDTVFHDRIDKLIAKTIEYSQINKINKLYIAIAGDMISGNIHISTRVQSNENLIRQIQVVSETISECVAELSKHIPEVELLFVTGNHGRSGKKDEVTSKENFELLIPWYVESRLNKFNNVTITNETDTFLIKNIEGNNCVFVHGNYDFVTSAAKNIPQILGFVPDLLFCGHIHHNYEKENGRTTVICGSSLIGVDDYALTKRFYAKPSQKFMIMNDEGIECTYNIKL